MVSCWSVFSPFSQHHHHHPPPRPQNTCSVSSEGKWQSGVSGETQRNHRAYLSLLPLTLNYSLKPPEFFLNTILQSATQDCWSHTVAPTDQTGGVGSGGLSCNIEKSETECFFSWLSFPEIFVLGLKQRRGRSLNFQTERLDRGTDNSDRDERCRSESQQLCDWLCNTIRCVIQTLITQWLSGDTESTCLSVSFALSTRILSKYSTSGSKAYRPVVPNFSLDCDAQFLTISDTPTSTLTTEVKSKQDLNSASFFSVTFCAYK